MTGGPHETEAGAAGDAAAWERVLRRWDDDEAHRAFLAASPGMEGLAEAGRRYKEALLRRPGDPVALRWRDEVLRRATALAFAQLPRTAPPRLAARPGLRRLLAGAIVLAMVAAIAFVLLRAPGVAR